MIFSMFVFAAMATDTVEMKIVDEPSSYGYGPQACFYLRLWGCQNMRVVLCVLLLLLLFFSIIYFSVNFQA